jgi:acyl-CoA thioester hydrolase
MHDAKAETSFRVRYAETDQMGVAYYGNYFTWMELGRVEYCRASGLRYRDMEEQDGILLVVVEASCRYHSPARYDDEVLIRTAITETNPRLIRFRYEMRDAATGRRIASGYTSHVFCGRDMKPVKLPVKYRGIFGMEARNVE